MPASSIQLGSHGLPGPHGWSPAAGSAAKAPSLEPIMLWKNGSGQLRRRGSIEVHWSPRGAKEKKEKNDVPAFAYVESSPSAVWLWGPATWRSRDRCECTGGQAAQAAQGVGR
jgi:hypothetical protein